MQHHFFEIQTFLSNLSCHLIAWLSVRSVIQGKQEGFKINKEQAHQHLFRTPDFSGGYLVAKHKSKCFNQDEIRPEVQRIGERIGHKRLRFTDKTDGSSEKQYQERQTKKIEKADFQKWEPLPQR